MWWLPMAHDRRLEERLLHSNAKLARAYRTAAQAALDNPYEHSRRLRRERAREYLRLARGYEKAMRQ